MIRQATLALLLLAATPVAFAATEKTSAPATTQVDLPALIECRGQLQQFRNLADAIADDRKIAALGFSSLPRANPYMTEFALARSITVFGQQTSRIAFTADGIIAVLDLADPRPLAQKLQLETAMDTPQRAMFGKEVRGEEVAAANGEKFWNSAVLDVSSVATHPGKTLAGCSYGLDPIDDDAPAPASSVPAAKK